MRQKARDALFAATLFSVLLLIPPILPFFDQDRSSFGIPVVIVYVFGVWFVLVGLTWWLSRRLPKEIPSGAPTGPAVEDSAPLRED